MSNRLYSKILASILFVASLDAAYAQETRPRAVEAGFCAGPTLGLVSPQNDLYKGTAAKVGGFYGLTADVNLIRTKEFAYFSTGLLFKHLHFGLEYSDFTAPYNELLNEPNIRSSYKTVYVSIPTAVKLKTDPFSDFAIFGVAGLEHGFCIYAKSNDEHLHDKNAEKINKVNQSDKISLMKESLFAVVGVEYAILGNTKAAFGLGYNYGLNSIFKRKYKNLINNERVSANVHTIEFQFSFIF